MQTADATPTSRIPDFLTTRLPLMWFAIAFLAGIVLGSLVSLSLPVWLALAALAILFLILSYIFRHRISLHAPRLAILPFTFALLLGLLLGAARYQMTVPKFDAYHIGFYNDRDYDLFVTGTLVEPPDYRDNYTNLRVKVTGVDTGDRQLPAEGLLLARVSNNQVFQYGDIVRLRGKVKTPPENEDFSYRDYLAAQHIHSYMPSAEVTLLPGNGGNAFLRAVYAFKEKSLENIYRLFPDPESSLLAGILLGVDTGLTDQLQQAFKDTGTAHIIAISGFNMSIIAGLFVLLFSRFLGARRGAMLAVVGIVLYTIMVGASAAVVRAALMGTLALFAVQVGRRQLALNTLLGVALLMCLWNPLYIWDVGFQLSFFATLGLILYADPFTRFSNRILMKLFPSVAGEKIAELFAEFVLLTFAAQLTTIPIMAYQFQRISLVSFIANPFILPPQPAVMILGGLAVLLSHLWFPLGQLAAWADWPFVVYTIRAVELFDKIPHGTIFLVNLSLWFVILFLALLFGVTLGGSRIKETAGSLKSRVRTVGIGGGILILGIGLLLIWRAASAIPDNRLHLTFLNVGSADAVLITSPTGKHVLVNGGPSVTTLSDDLGRRLPAFNRKLDWLVVGSTEENQVAALPRILDRYPPDQVLWSGNKQASFSSGVLSEYLSTQNIPVTDAKPGQILDLGDGATIKVVTSGPRGAILLVEWDKFRALLPVGMSFEALDELHLGADIGPVSLLSLADSGYAASNPPEWINNLNPELAVLNVSAADENGMPDREVMDMLKDYDVLRTDRNGWIDVATDGSRMWVNVERNKDDLAP
ncbi:MAG: ComEC/Rec2 family competence protein [Bacteroidota bacterium]